MNTGCLRPMTSVTGAGIGEIHRVFPVMSTVPHLVHPFIPIANIQIPTTYQPHQVPLLIALHMVCSHYHMSHNPCSIGSPTLNQQHHRFPPTQHLSCLHAQNHPRHQDAVVIEEVRFSRTSQATHPSAETAHAALNRICGSHHQVVVPPRVHEKSLSPLDALRFALLSYQSLDCDAKPLAPVILFTYSCFLNKHQRNHTRMIQYPRRP